VMHIKIKGKLKTDESRLYFQLKSMAEYQVGVL
jgi:hypothetical protein